MWEHTFNLLLFRATSEDREANCKLGKVDEAICVFIVEAEQTVGEKIFLSTQRTEARIVSTSIDALGASCGKRELLVENQ